MDSSPIVLLYQNILQSWNERDAEKMASLFALNGKTVGFDGSELSGQIAIKSELARIFSHHQTQKYVAKVREVVWLSSEVAMLYAVAGMIEEGKKKVDPNLNTVQTMVAIFKDSKWQVALFQNTPAAFHGRPQMREALTSELNELVGAK